MRYCSHCDKYVSVKSNFRWRDIIITAMILSFILNYKSGFSAGILPWVLAIIPALMPGTRCSICNHETEKITVNGRVNEKVKDETEHNIMKSEYANNLIRKKQDIANKNIFLTLMLSILLPPVAYVYVKKNWYGLFNLLTLNWFLIGIIFTPLYCCDIVYEARKEVKAAKEARKDTGIEDPIKLLKKYMMDED